MRPESTRPAALTQLDSETDFVRLLSGLEATAALTADSIATRPRPHSVASRARSPRSARAKPAQRSSGQSEWLTSNGRALLDALPVAVLWLNAAGIVAHCNARALARLGTPLLGEPWRRIAEAQLLRQTLERSAPADLVVASNAFMNGQLIVLAEFEAATGAGANLHAAEGIATARARRTPRKAHSETAQREQQLARLGRLCAGLAHQLRTPIAAAQLYLDLAGSTGEPSYLVKAQSALDALTRHSESVLTLARGELLCEPNVALVTLLQLVARQADALSGHLQIDAEVDGLTLRCNPHLLAGALLNLIDNALRASPRSWARLHVHRDAGALLFVITDDGAGFPVRLLPRIGQPLPSNRIDGAGLGLAMANMIALAHGGRLLIEAAGAGESCAGTGTRVSLVLPLQVDARLASRSLAQSAAANVSAAVPKRSRQISGTSST